MRSGLKKLRKEKGLTQEKIAEQVGIHRAHYTNIERGNSNPSIKVMLKIKEVLGTEKDDIFLVNNVEYAHKKDAKAS